MKNKLQIRLAEPEGYYYGYFGGKKYSIVDFGTTCKSHLMPAGLFLGWEALAFDGDMLESEGIRAGSRDELIHKLESLPLGLTAVLRDYNGFEKEMFFPGYMPRISIVLKHPTTYLKTADFETTARDLSVEQRDFYFKEWIDEKSMVALFTEI